MPIPSSAIAPSMYIVLTSHGFLANGYHWLILTTYMDGTCIAFHATQDPGWCYQQKEWQMITSMTLVVAILISKAHLSTSIDQILQDIPMETPAAEVSVTFSCCIWVKEAACHLVTGHLMTCNDVNTLEGEVIAAANQHADSIMIGGTGAVYRSRACGTAE
ncbi:hypothetical protein DACRYDRAFT_107018 [Dacryopinax primogenitus]|uniref:Uncharacterized protein n=1 Tax=Dacryopinax primogenitus (strain DJM 731) TaxID=1858805 RepID=M5FW28_DACPD|nr:uncharacterized protein DACRYDRAFT_107018 [Dacryopinax primogenitus]EJU02071.1 hypothetical protein DACRYDRAFT_107018 [Dacryopinax primogenitus]